MFYQLLLRSINISCASNREVFVVGIIYQNIHVTRYLVMKSLCTQVISPSSFGVGKKVNILDLSEKLVEV